MIKEYFELCSVKKILNLRNSFLDINHDIVDKKMLESFFNETLLYVSIFGISEIRIVLNVLINFIFDNFKSILKECDYDLVFQIIKVLDYYPHLSKIGLNDEQTDFINYLNVEIRKVDDYILNDSQINLYKNIISKNQIIYSAPTSYGKTTICINAFLNLLKVEKINNLLIIAPTKALINEYKKNISSNIEKTNVDVRIVESAYIPFNNKAKTIYIFTQERVLSFFINNERISSIDYLLIDEAQTISYLKNKRTPLLLKAISLFNKCSKVYLTPFVKNFNNNVVQKLETNNDYKEIVVTGKDSLVANNKFIIDLYNYEKILLKDVTFSDSIYSKEYIRKYEHKQKNSDFLNVLPIILQRTEENEKTIIFTTSVYNSIEWPKILAKKHYLKNKKKYKRLNALISHLRNNIHKDFDLIELLENGIAYHNSYLDSFTKRQIEYLFTEESDAIKYLFCTNTISQGVNFSAKNLYIFVSQIRSDNPNLDFVNLLGRAARLKYNGLGNVYFVKKNKNTKYEKMFLNSNENLDIKLTNISENDIKNISNIELRSYISDTMIQNKNKEEINTNFKYLNDYIEKKPIDQHNYSIEQSDISIIEKRISKLKKEELTKYLKFYKSYDDTLNFIEYLKRLYNWERIYNGNNRPESIRKRRILNTDFIATVITKLIQGNTINNIIDFSCNNSKQRELFVNCDEKLVSYKEQKGYEKLDLNNKKHINVIIINSLFDVQNIIEFEVKKFIQDFYYRVNKIHNIDFKDSDLENFIDFTTIDNQKIKLMNAGITDAFAINELIKNEKYKSIIEHNNIDKKELLNKIKEIESDESPVYYAVYDSMK